MVGWKGGGPRRKGPPLNTPLWLMAVWRDMRLIWTLRSNLCLQVYNGRQPGKHSITHVENKTNAFAPSTFTPFGTARLRYDELLSVDTVFFILGPIALLDSQAVRDSLPQLPFHYVVYLLVFFITHPYSHSRMLSAILNCSISSVCPSVGIAAVTLAWRAVSSSLQITNRSFRYAMHHLTCGINSLLHSVNLIVFTLLLVHLCAYHLITVTVFALTIYHSLNLSLQTDNSSLSQILSSIVFWFLPDCLHGSGICTELSGHWRLFVLN